MTNCHYADVKDNTSVFWIDNCYVYVLFRYKLNKKMKNEKQNKKTQKQQQYKAI